MKSFKWVQAAMLFCAAGFAGCGGGGGSEGNSPLGTGNTPVVTAADLDISPSSLQIPNSPGTSIVITVTALDSNRKALAGASVDIEVTTKNAVLSPAPKVTDAQGKLTVTISAGGDPTLRQVIVTARSGGVVKSATLQVGSTGVIATDIDLVLSQAQLPNISAAKVTLTATALDSGKRALKDVDVVISVASGSDAVVTQLTTKTDAQGRVSADIAAGANKANRTVILEATTGSLRKTTSVQVVGAVITSTVSSPVIAPGAAATVRYRVVDQSTNPMPNQAAQVSAVGFTPATATGITDPNGEYVYSFTAPVATGAYTISTTIAGARSDILVNVQPVSSVPPVPETTNILSASVSANPSVVAINATGALNRAEIRAIFLSTDNKPIPNVRARFDLNGDPNAIGGLFTNGNQVLYSDANGIVTTAYIPGSRSSPTNGVTVRVCYAKTDLELVNACPSAAFVSLTVINDPLGVTIGTDGLIEVNAANLTYIRKYVVQVVDSAGLAKSDVNLTVSIDLPAYYKGQYCLGAVDAVTKQFVCGGAGDSWGIGTPVVGCLNEDANRNGFLESGEDVDNDGRLDPGKSDVAVRLLSPKTGTAGTALLQIEYPQNYGSWVATSITVAASGVLGTEGRASYLENPVPVPADALKNKDVSPPFQRSPYGTMPSCTNPF